LDQVIKYMIAAYAPRRVNHLIETKAEAQDKPPSQRIMVSWYTDISQVGKPNNRPNGRSISPARPVKNPKSIVKGINGSTSKFAGNETIENCLK